MFIDYDKNIKDITSQFNEKKTKKLGIDTLINLSIKLYEYQNKEVEDLMIQLKNSLENLNFDDKKQQKKYLKDFALLKQLVKSQFDLHEKGSILTTYTAFGMMIGLSVGTGVSSGKGTGIGISLGLVFGSAIGTQREKQMKEEGKLY